MSKKATPKPKSPRQKRRAESRARKRKQRKDALVALAWKNAHHARPLAINLEALATASAYHYLDPTLAAAVGGASALITAVNTWMGRLSTEEQKLIGYHSLAAATWTAIASLVGPFDPFLGGAGLLGSIASHVTWAERRKVRKPALAERPVFEDWNGAENEDEDNGILARAGFRGARMVGREPMNNAKNQQIGIRYHVDLTGSGVSAETMLALGPKKIAAELPGKTRQGAVTILDDEDDVNHVVIEVIWQKQWSASAPVLHPIVEYLPELTQLVQSAVEHRLSGDTSNAVPIPAHLRYLLPGMATIRDQVLAGVKPDQSLAYEQIYKKGYGCYHEFGVGFTGSGKTSSINCEICSLLPCNDVVIWAIDVSAKRGKHFKPWGGCIDWLATEAADALEMLKAVRNIANARGRAYNKSAIVSPRTAPVLVVIIDELPALWDELGSERCNEFLGNLTKQARSQGISLKFWGQRGIQTDYGHGFQSVISQAAQRRLMKVKKAHEAGFVLSNADLLQADASKFLAGETVIEDGETGEMTHFRGFLVREADDEVEDDLGDIPFIAALYAPFRPKLDAVSAQAAGDAYAKRQVIIPDNPMLTPQEVMSPRITVPPATEAEADEVIRALTTNIGWLDAMLDGRLTVSGITFDSDTEEDPVVSSAPELDTGAVFADAGIPLGDSDSAREKRSGMLTEQLHTQMGPAIADLAALQAEIDAIPKGVSLAAATMRTEDPKRFADDDAIVVAALEVIGRHSHKGAQNADIAAAIEKTTGRKPSPEAIRQRLRDLSHRNLVVLDGKNRGARWYLPHHAPTSDNK
jgi:hypothetical protein